MSNLKVVKKKDIVFIDILNETELDISTADKILNDVLTEALKSDARDVKLNMSGIEFMDAHAMWAMIRIHRELKAEGKCLVIQNTHKEVDRVFRITKADKVLNIEDDLSARNKNVGSEQ